MGRYIFGGKEAYLPYEAEELDVRIYTVEELCYYIYHNLPLIDDRFLDDRLLLFLEKELGETDLAEKIRKFYASAYDQDALLYMLLSEVGYYQDSELVDFQTRLAFRRRLSGPEKSFLRGKWLYEKKRYSKAIHYFRQLEHETGDNRITYEIRLNVFSYTAACYAKLFAFPKAIAYLKKAYDFSKQEKYLKRIFELSMISGTEVSEKIYAEIPDETMSLWKREYKGKEAVVSGKIEEDALLEVFFKEDSERREILSDYADRRKENYRRMLE